MNAKKYIKLFNQVKKINYYILILNLSIYFFGLIVLTSCDTQVKDTTTISSSKINKNTKKIVNDKTIIVSKNIKRQNLVDINKVLMIIDNKRKEMKPYGYEDKLNEILEELGLKKISTEEIRLKGIKNIEDAANKIFDIRRPLTNEDKEDILKLDPEKYMKLLKVATRKDMNHERLYNLYLIMVNDSMPANIHAEAVCKAAAIGAVTKHNNQTEKLCEIALKLSRENDFSKYEKLALNELESYHWSNQQYEKCLIICEDKIDWLKRNQEVEYYGSYLGAALTTKIRSLALLKRQEDAIKELEKAINAPVTEQYKEKFKSENFKKEILLY